MCCLNYSDLSSFTLQQSGGKNHRLFGEKLNLAVIKDIVITFVLRVNKDYMIIIILLTYHMFVLLMLSSILFVGHTVL